MQDIAKAGMYLGFSVIVWALAAWAVVGVWVIIRDMLQGK